MIQWIIFISAVLFIGLLGLWGWDEISLWYDHEQHELLLDELWASDDDLADSC